MSLPFPMVTPLLILLVSYSPLSNAYANDKGTFHIDIQSVDKEEEYTDSITPPRASDVGKESALDEEDVEVYFAEEAVDIDVPPEKQLPADTKKTLEKISKQIESSANKPSQTIVIEHGKTKTLQSEQQTDEKKKPSFSIKMADKKERPITADVLMEQAYKALMAGQTEAAASLYKRALKLAPDNYAAQFGLATTYHKNKQFRQAKKIYTDILAVRPHDTETLNNFLVLIAEEAPEDALVELKKLEKNNTTYSPITAQIGMLYQKTGNTKKSVQYLKRAISMSPENISYRYNLAVIFDKMQHHKEAVALYKQVLAAAQQGAVIPGNIRNIHKRIEFIEKNQ